MRKLRYRAVLKERIGNTGGVYFNQVAQQQGFWKEDKHPNPSIVQVRKLHSFLGSWDVKTKWYRIEGLDGFLNNTIYISNTMSDIKPKANYKPIKKEKEAQWKEQEQRTIEFFESMGV